MKKLNVIHYQAICHFLYILLSFKLHLQERPIWLIATMLLFALLMEICYAKMVNREYLLSFAALGTANSIYLNMEGYGLYYWPFFLALLVSLLAKYYLRMYGRPIINPSFVGVFLIATVFPEFGSANMIAWNNNWMYVALVFATGLFVTYKSRTAALGLSYIISFMLFALIFVFGVRTFLPGLAPVLFPNSIPLLFFPCTILTFGNILFAFHGIGDPATSPVSMRGQICFGLLMGVIDFLLRFIPMVAAAPPLTYVFLLLVLAFYRYYRQRSLLVPA